MSSSYETSLERNMWLRVSNPDSVFGEITQDNLTECVGLAAALAPDFVSISERAFAVPAIFSCERLTQYLADSDRVGSGTEFDRYGRFWHGYRVITVPVVAFFGQPMMSFGVTLRSLWLIARLGTAVRTGGRSRLILVAALLVVFPHDALFLFQHASSVWLALGMTLFFLNPGRGWVLWLEDRFSLTGIFLLYGFVANFGTMMMFPPLLFALPMGALAMSGPNIRGGLKNQVHFAVCAGLAFVFTWSAKLVVMKFAYPDVFQNAITQVDHWRGSDISLWFSARRSFGVRLWPGVLVCAFAMACWAQLRWRHVALLIPGAACSILFMAVARGHTIHGFSYVSGIGVWLLGLGLVSAVVSSTLGSARLQRVGMPSMRGNYRADLSSPRA